ncbi:MAG TPA: hypothetical protein VGA40_00450 [Candidatus Acidoferrales bacterium]
MRRPHAVVTHNAARFLVLSALVCAACQSVPDTRPLDDAGMAYTTVTELRKMNLTEAEVAELVLAKQGGVSDRTCLELVRIAQSRQQKFTIGNDAARLKRAGMTEASILELVRLNQMGDWVGEVQALRLANIPEPLIMTLTRRRVAGQASLSSSSLARLKNAALADGTLFALVERGITDDAVEEILNLRLQRRMGDADILRRYPAK